MSRSTLLSRWTAPVLTAALLTGLSGRAALAQPADESPKQLEGSFDQPLGGGGGGDEGAGQSRMVLQSSNGEDTFKLEVSGNKLKAWHNGKAVPKDRVRRSKDKVELLDKDGNVMHTFRVGAGGAIGVGPGGAGAGGDGNGRFFFREGQPTPPDAPTPPPEAGQAFVMQNVPPVMLGITMSDADDDLLGELNEGRDGEKIQSGIVVDRVVEGLPADKAGIEEGDVIIAVGGDRGLSQEDLRNLLRDRKPGDELKLQIVRDGKSRDVAIKLEKFDPARLNPGMAAGPGEVEVEGMPAWIQRFGGEQGKAKYDEARKALEQALKELKSNEKLQPENIRGEVEKAMEKALAALREAESSGRLQLDKLLGQGQDGRTYMWSGRPDQFYTVPPATPRADGDTSRKLDRLGEQLERLNRRLDELERRLDRDGR